MAGGSAQLSGPPVLPAAESNDRWHHVLSAARLPWSLYLSSTPGSRFHADIGRYGIDDLTLADISCGPSSWVRQRSEIAATDGAYIGMQFTVSGEQVLQQDDHATVMRPGAVIVWDSTRPVQLAVTHSVVARTLVLPRVALDEVSGPAWAATGIALDIKGPATRLLTTYLDALSETVSTLSPVARAAARNATLELIMGAARMAANVTSSEVVGPALRAAIDRYIDRHLLDGTVTPAAIASAHGVSIRTAQRAYQADGETLTNVIRIRRLAHARTELITSASSIAQIASHWGFADSSHFSRLFKAHYGRSPREYRDAAGYGEA